MLEEIRSLGFEYAELSHGIRLSLLPGILDAVDAGLVRISSVHNFCPLPVGVERAAPNLFQFSSEDRRERESAWRYTHKSLETCERVKAPVLVLHMGSVDMKDYTDRLLELMEEGKRDTPKFAKLVDEACKKREARKERYCNAAYDLLERLVPEAKVRGVTLGIENREAIEEIPFESDLELFFRQFKTPTIRYWHDTGHAQIKENLGFIRHAMHLESFAERLAGLHIHDVAYPGKDHQQPGTGCVNFAALQPFVGPDHIKVFEFRSSLEPEQVLAGVAHVKSLWGPE